MKDPVEPVLCKRQEYHASENAQLSWMTEIDMATSDSPAGVRPIFSHEYAVLYMP